MRAKTRAWKGLSAEKKAMVLPQKGREENCLLSGMEIWARRRQVGKPRENDSVVQIVT